MTRLARATAPGEEPEPYYATVAGLLIVLLGALPTNAQQRRAAATPASTDYRSPPQGFMVNPTLLEFGVIFVVLGSPLHQQVRLPRPLCSPGVAKS
jgi:hypothetical protein